MNIPENPSAFPFVYEDRTVAGACCTHVIEGMHLRDYFAAKAMASFNTPRAVVEALDAGEIGKYTELIARASYTMADAMLAARQPVTQST